MLWAALGAAVVVIVVQHRLRRRETAHLAQRLTTASRSLESLQHAFSSFAPAAVVEDIIAQGVSTRSEKKEVTVLFADLREFTPLSERLDATQVVEILNGFFERMSRAITSHRGHVAKFIGDGMLAHFGALDANPWQTNDAVHAALAMRAALADYNAALRTRGMPELAMGIGIHRGTVVAGVIGSAALVEYGVIGSTVNVAARVERLTRTHDADILLTDAARAVIDRRFRLRAMAPTPVKGVAAPVGTFAVDGFDEDAEGAR